ncbi:hypothetical protein MSG28_000861 [Choristoneura fumiferana]|uniref:Uncharacterized protein n=1 Tax=Choristoneura fumiferana TaxID=7141 RepID=A0ACC0K2Q6_CHOFU|nr:hypothetical protein MSG28_000861 [Choristoneura fumiferana]
MAEPKADIALIGLAVMGQNLILNMDSKGFVVCAFNRTVAKVDEFLANEAKGTKIIGAKSLEDMVSGGEDGARYGPSLMPGGHPEAWPHLKPIFQAICAKANDEPCCDWVGEDGAGHFVKMVHNGIEYGDMQLICEAYHLMKDVLGMEQDEMARVFEEWNKGELDSFLIEITRDILKFKDADGKYLLPKIRDSAGQKGTGKWTGISALEYGVPVTLIGEAVFARCLSALKEERVRASNTLPGSSKKFSGDKKAFLEQLRQALFASKIISYAQGFMLLREAAKESLRQVVAQTALVGVPAPAFSAALAFYDGYRSAVLPANLLQAQRDYFGAHTYELASKPGEYIHTNWTGHGGNVSASTYTTLIYSMYVGSPVVGWAKMVYGLILVTVLLVMWAPCIRQGMWTNPTPSFDLARRQSALSSLRERPALVPALLPPLLPPPFIDVQRIEALGMAEAHVHTCSGGVRVRVLVRVSLTASARLPAGECAPDIAFRVELKDDEDKDRFYDELDLVYEQVPEYDARIIVGDFNAKIGREEAFISTIGRHSKHEESNDNGIRLISFAALKSMVVKRTMFPHKNIYKGTWKSPDGVTVNQIDHVLIDNRHKSIIENRPPPQTGVLIAGRQHGILAGDSALVRQPPPLRVQPRRWQHVLRNAREVLSAAPVAMGNFGTLHYAWIDFKKSYISLAVHVGELQPAVLLERVPEELLVPVDSHAELVSPGGSPKTEQRALCVRSPHCVPCGQLLHDVPDSIKHFEEILGNEIIDINSLRKLAFNGIPEDKGLRSLVWKILLHYIPPEKNNWESTILTKRQLYNQYINEIIVSPGGPSDHPLNISPDSSWSTYFKDNEVLLQIDKDLSNEIRRSDSQPHGDYAPLREGCEAHWEVVERLLFLYAKLNPGQGYNMPKRTAFFVLRI